MRIAPTPNDAAPMRPQSWSFLKTPLAVYLVVMTPINGLMAFLIAVGTPPWMKITSACVILFTLLTLLRGYLRRLTVDGEGLTLKGPIHRGISIPWESVRGLGVYVPGGGVGGTPYLFATRRDSAPAGKWDIDSETIQIQDREGLLEALLAAQKESKPGPTD